MSEAARGFVAHLFATSRADAIYTAACSRECRIAAHPGKARLQRDARDTRSGLETARRRIAARQHEPDTRRIRAAVLRDFVRRRSMNLVAIARHECPGPTATKLAGRGSAFIRARQAPEPKPFRQRGRAFRFFGFGAPFAKDASHDQESSSPARFPTSTASSISAISSARCCRPTCMPASTARSATTCCSSAAPTSTARRPSSARRAGQDVRAYCAAQHAIQADIYRRFGLSFDHFGRSSAPQNHALTQHFYRRLDAAGLIEERNVPQVWSAPTGASCPTATCSAPARIAATRPRAATSATIAARCSIRST